MSEEIDAAVERLESILVELELSPAELRRDPHGVGWLPVEARGLVQAHPECHVALDEFVVGELELWSARSEPAAPLAVDPFFTARVVEALPSPRTGTRLSPRRRAMVLGLFHVVGGLLAFLVLTMVPESTARWAERAHSMLSWGSEIGGAPWLFATAIGAAVLLFIVAGRTHTPTA